MSERQAEMRRRQVLQPVAVPTNNPSDDEADEEPLPKHLTLAQAKAELCVSRDTARRMFEGRGDLGVWVKGVGTKRKQIMIPREAIKAILAERADDRRSA